MAPPTADGRTSSDAFTQEGRRLLDSGMVENAVTLLSRACADAGFDESSAGWLAEAHLASGAIADSAATLDRALETTPFSARLLVLRSEVALRSGALDFAETVLDQAMAAGVVSADVLAQRARVCYFAGEFIKSIELNRRALAFDPCNPSIQSAIVMSAAADPAMTTEQLKAIQGTWSLAKDRRRPTAPLNLAAGEKLRIGYVSSCFHAHAAMKVCSTFLFNHDPDGFEIYCYSSNRIRDATSVRLRLAAAQWRTIVGLDDADAADVIRNDGINVLVDLDGHYHRNRLGIFALRGAPVQVSGWGYVAGPGTPGVDYLMTDSIVAPDDEAHLFPEKLIRLPSAQPYAAHALRAPIAVAADVDGQPVRFGCFNRYQKLDDITLGTWAEILRQVPGSTLTLKDRFFSQAGPRDRILRILRGGGIDTARVNFETNERHDRYLAAFDRIDLALDPFPVNGGVTTLDGILQGVPAIAQTGGHPAARLGASILTAVQLPDLIFRTASDYIRAAISLGRNRNALAGLRRRTLSAATKFSTTAAQAYTRHVEDAYREIWSRHCHNDPDAPLF